MGEVLRQKAKAVVGAVVSGAAVYVAEAIIQSSVLTLHGLEAAVATGVLTGLGVHQTRNKQKAAPAKQV